MTTNPHRRGEETTATVREEVLDASTAIMPWAISALLHAGVVLLSAFLVWTTAESGAETDDEIIIPRLTEYRSGPPLLLNSESSDGKSHLRSAMDTLSASSASALAVPSSLDVRRVGGGPGRGAGKGDSGTPGNAPGSNGFRGWGPRGLSKPGSTGPGGKESPFGPGDARTGPTTSVFKTPRQAGNARSFVFLIDASGSLIDTLPFVILELNRFIGMLNENQSFNVIFFQGDQPIEATVPQPGLKRGTMANKMAVIDWINPRAGHVVPQGKSNPLPALQLALKQNPDVLFILSDNITGQGVYQVDQRRLIEEIDRRATGKTKISTVQFIYPDPLSKVGMKPTLEMIAERFGGEYRFIDGRELGIE